MDVMVVTQKLRVHSLDESDASSVGEEISEVGE